MQVRVASSSPLALHLVVLLSLLNTITHTQVFSKAEQKHFFLKAKNESIHAGRSTTRPPLYRVSPAMFQQEGVGRGSLLRHESLRGDAHEPEEGFSIAKHNHGEFSYTTPSSIIHYESNPGLKGNIEDHPNMAKLPQSIPYYARNDRRPHKKGKGNNKPPVRFTIPPEYTRTTQPVYYTTERATMHPTTTETFFTTWPTTSGIEGKGHHKPPSKFTIPPEYTPMTEPFHHETEPVTSYPYTTQHVHITSGIKKGKGHHKPASKFTIPAEYTQTTEPVHYTTEPVTVHPTTTGREIFTTHPTTAGVKKGKGHHKPASKFTIPPEYTRTTEPVHYPTEPVTSTPETTQYVYITQPTTLGDHKGKGHHTPATMFTIPPEYTQTTKAVYYPTEQVTMHPTTSEEEVVTTHPITTQGSKKGKGHHKPVSMFTIPHDYTQTTEPVYYHTDLETTQKVYTTQPTTSGIKKGKGHHRPATMFTIPPEYTQTTEPDVYYPTEQVTLHPTTTEKEILTTHFITTQGLEKGKGHHKPVSMFTIPHEFTQTTEPVNYETEPFTTQQVHITYPATSGIKKGKGHHKPASKFTVPAEYTQTTVPVQYTTEQVTVHPDNTEEVYITQPTTSGVKKGKGHQKPGFMFTIPPEYTKTTKPVYYSTEPLTTAQIYITHPTTHWSMKGKGHKKPVSKFTIPYEYTMTTQSNYNPTTMFHTSNPMDYGQSTSSVEFLTINNEPHNWQTSTISYPDTTHSYEDGQSTDEQFTIPGYEGSKPGHSEGIVTKPAFFTEAPIKYESTPVIYQTNQYNGMQTDFQSTEYPHYEESPSMQNTEPAHYQTMKYSDFDQSTVPVEIPSESSTEPQHYEEFSTIQTDSSMQSTEPSHFHTDKYSDYDQATVPVEITHQSPQNPHYEESTTQTDSFMQYTTPVHHQTDRYVDDDQATVPIEIPTQQSTKYPHYQESPTTHPDLSMQFTESSQYHSTMDMEDDQSTVPVEILIGSTKYPHYEDLSTPYSDSSMQYTESSSVVYTDDEQATVPIEILPESSTKYPHYEDHSVPSMQTTEYHNTDKYTDDDQATVPVEIPSHFLTKNPHYESSTVKPDLTAHFTTPSHYHSGESSDDQATVPIDVAMETTTEMESHHIESTSGYKQPVESDSSLQSKVPLSPSDKDEQHHLHVDFSDDENEEDFDQQSITHPYFAHPTQSTPANRPEELDWRSGSTVHIKPGKKYTVAPSDFFLTPIAPFKPVEFIPPQPYKQWPSQSALNSTGIDQVKVPDTIQVDLKGYPSYAENRPGIKGRGGRHNMISKPWYFMSRTFH
ncbi:uncharacterized protein LOC111049048 isoform X2 [Nilaparvata lugens]|uniref:uncharacterized protein LOC111049048 isoform X2 n=1 Tax=Nilaparvata lugens TaxID=108931 RepID=UPI00193CCEA6|nr:uncharacterized protein LOC111049048 isoform X2 [Nilaparvata lugens]